MRIEEYFPKVQSYEQLCEIAKYAEPKLSFWGKEYLVVDGYPGTLEINAIYRRSIHLIKKKPEFNERERSLGKKIAGRISYIYEKSNSNLISSSIITKIIHFFRDFELNYYGRLKTQWEFFGDRFAFEFYSRSQFENVFWCSPETAQSRGYQLTRCNDLWMVVSYPRLIWPLHNILPNKILIEDAHKTLHQPISRANIFG